MVCCIYACRLLLFQNNRFLQSPAGLPPTKDSVLAELAVVNCLLQVQMLMSLCSTTAKHPAIVVNKYLPDVCQRCKCMYHNSHTDMYNVVRIFFCVTIL